MSVSRRHVLQAAGAGAVVVVGASCRPLDEVINRLNAQLVGNLEDFSPAQGTEIDAITHAVNRLTFGIAPGQYQEIASGDKDPQKAAAAFVEQQLDPASINDLRAKRFTSGYEYLYLQSADHFNFNKDSLLLEMLRYTTARATYSKRQLHEVMVQFWSDHFNVDSSKGDCRWLTAASDRDVIRKHAMGKFSDLLRGSALSPAMLWYLDGRVNKVERGTDEKPNENYARELLELHTLGVDGGYTQEDVMEVARALTGWTTPARNQLKLGVGIGLATLKFNRDHHDDGEKTILGTTVPAGLGKKEIDRVLEIVANHPSTARYIAEKLCRRFIADEPPASAIAVVAQAFTASEGEIAPTLRALFGTPEFWANRGNKVKRPFNFVVSCLRATRASTDAKDPLLEFVRRMGHAPFHCPTPDGFAEEAQPWMATLLWRWNFAIKLGRGEIAGTRFDAEKLAEAAGGHPGLMRHFLGRAPTDAEAEAFANAKGDGLALLMACPAFQTC